MVEEEGGAEGVAAAAGAVDGEALLGHGILGHGAAQAQGAVAGGADAGEELALGGGVGEVTVGAFGPAEVAQGAAGVVRVAGEHSAVHGHAIKRDLAGGGLALAVGLGVAKAAAGGFHEHGDAAHAGQLERGEGELPLEVAGAVTGAGAEAREFVGGGERLGPRGAVEGVDGGAQDELVGVVLAGGILRRGHEELHEVRRDLLALVVNGLKPERAEHWRLGEGELDGVRGGDAELRKGDGHAAAHEILVRAAE